MPQGTAMAVGEDFARLTDPFRPELLAHCYRMLGSVHEAEDQVQETMIRAWRSYGDFEGRASLRTWLYPLPTNACLRALETTTRRPLPSRLRGPGPDPAAPPAAPRPRVPRLLGGHGRFGMWSRAGWRVRREVVGVLLRAGVRTEPGAAKKPPRATTGQPAGAAKVRGRQGASRPRP